MSTGRERPGGGRRRLTPDEQALWRAVTRAVAPLRSEPPAAPETDAAVDQAIVPLPEPSVTVRVKPPPPAGKAPPLAPLGRRLKQRVARGSEPIDARIDLHGRTQEEAHRALRRFLRGAQADGARLVLVITGKGARSNEPFSSERGVLRRLVPQWLRLPEFRASVVGFEPAHAAHGGEGALYVRIRRAQRS